MEAGRHKQTSGGDDGNRGGCLKQGRRPSCGRRCLTSEDAMEPPCRVRCQCTIPAISSRVRRSASCALRERVRQVPCFCGLAPPTIGRTAWRSRAAGRLAAFRLPALGCGGPSSLRRTGCGAADRGRATWPRTAGLAPGACTAVTAKPACLPCSRHRETTPDQRSRRHSCPARASPASGAVRCTTSMVLRACLPACLPADGRAGGRAGGRASGATVLRLRALRKLPMAVDRQPRKGRCNPHGRADSAAFGLSLLHGADASVRCRCRASRTPLKTWRPRWAVMPVQMTVTADRADAACHGTALARSLVLVSGACSRTPLS